MIVISELIQYYKTGARHLYYIKMVNKNVPEDSGLNTLDKNK